jgi:hypothetical protein
VRDEPSTVSRVQPKSIPFHRPMFDEREVAAVTDVLRSGWITTGERTAEFEKRFAGVRRRDARRGVELLHRGAAHRARGRGDRARRRGLTTPVHLRRDRRDDLLRGGDPRARGCRPGNAEYRPGAHRSQDHSAHPSDRSGPRRRAARARWIRSRISRAATDLAVIEDAAHSLPASYRGRRSEPFRRRRRSVSTRRRT